jgi:excinuclease ABC subunit A
VLIEHNMDIIKNADWVLDFGPEGGEGGGRLVGKGTPEDIAQNKHSHTGTYLLRVLKGT